MPGAAPMLVDRGGVAWREDRMRLLLDVVQRLSQVRSDQEIRDIVKRAARQLLDAEGATFVLRDVDRYYLRR